ncbi:MAG: HNH endonuclease [Bryobacterales bacterium]|nr:HNH endonuclease [Bryobacterales bacterium]
MNRDLVRRAAERCEYCRLPQFGLPLPFQIDQVIATQHDKETELSNLALACPHCNRHKGPNIAGRDPANAFGSSILVKTSGVPVERPGAEQCMSC